MLHTDTVNGAPSARTLERDPGRLVERLTSARAVAVERDASRRYAQPPRGYERSVSEKSPDELFGQEHVHRYRETDGEVTRGRST